MILYLLFWVLWACLAMTSKDDTISLQKTLMFVFIQKFMLIHHFFLKYCKDIANLLFWVPWACLATPTKNDRSNL